MVLDSSQSEPWARVADFLREGFLKRSDIYLGFLLTKVVTLPQFFNKTTALATDEFQVLIIELAPVVLNQTPEMLPILLDVTPIHTWSFLSSAKHE
jgi:hypothetical protein